MSEHEFTFKIKASKTLDGPDRTHNEVGRAIAEQIADKVADVVIPSGERISFYVLTSIDFDREDLIAPATNEIAVAPRIGEDWP